jgi:hypothetical protein
VGARETKKTIAGKRELDRTEKQKSGAAIFFRRERKSSAAIFAAQNICGAYDHNDFEMSLAIT